MIAFRPALALAVAACLAVPGLASAADYKTPRTPFGDPDLQGIWTNASITVLERNPAVAKGVLTPEEAKVFEGRMAQMMEAGNRPTDPNEGAPTAGDNVGAYNSAWLDPGSHLGVVRGEIRTGWVLSPNGRVPYSPEAGRKMMIRMATQFGNYDNPENRSLGERCIVGFGSTAGPPMLNTLYNSNYQIVQVPGQVMIMAEMNHDVRIIRLTDKHLPDSLRPWMGDSIGHWEGDTLVVETTNLNPNQEFTADVRHRLYVPADAKVIERFTRISDKEFLYEFKVDHPAYTQPLIGEIPFRATEGPIYEYACHEGNYSLPSILGGTRQAEQAAAAAKTGVAKP
jgi:hypothetical protein